MPGSRLGRLIIVLQMLSLAILIGGALVLNEFRRGLVDTGISTLTSQGLTYANLIDQSATVAEPEPALDEARAGKILELLFVDKNQRVRLFDSSGHVLIDSANISGQIEQRPLPPARRPGQTEWRWPWQAPPDQAALDAHHKALADLQREITTAAARGQPVGEVRRADNGERVISVSVPVQRVAAVLGVLTLESAGVDQIVAAQRAALLPFILIAIAVSIVSSLLLNLWVARPIRRLSRAADAVRLSSIRTMSLPDLADRDDEVGDLSRALEAMTAAQSARMDAVEHFAADVSHEIKNPLTSMRSAVETLEMNSTPQAQARLLPILKKDVDRLDRLITDISNASRLDAELSRETPRAIDMGRLLGDLAGLYEATQRPGEPAIRYTPPREPLSVTGREGPLGQVFRNLIDNARSFSPEGGTVSIAVARGPGRMVVATVEDEGPGIPPDNLESVFERFYTERPKAHPAQSGGASASGHSGLGLSIARQIVEAHGGRIRAENRAADQAEGGGARARHNRPRP